MAGTTVKPFLMFQGDAEKAMTFYVSLFADGSIIDQSGGITVADTGAGSYLVRFPRSVKGQAISVTPTVTAADVNPTGGGLVRVAPCVTPSPPAFSCAPAANDNQNVGVFTKNETGAAADRSYLLTVFYP